LSIKQHAFLDEYEQIKADKCQNDPVYFADATHPQHNSVPSYGWIKKGQEKELKCKRRSKIVPPGGAKMYHPFTV